MLCDDSLLFVVVVVSVTHLIMLSDFYKNSEPGAIIEANAKLILSLIMNDRVLLCRLVEMIICLTVFGTNSVHKSLVGVFSSENIF